MSITFWLTARTRPLDRIVKIDYAPYELLPKSSFSLTHQGGRRGALLKVFFTPSLVGFADCHPWTSLGDLPIDRQLQLLSCGEKTTLTANALSLALIDARYRQNKENAFFGKPFPQSHFLIVDLFSCSQETLEGLETRGYSCVKIKLGSCLEKEGPQLLSLFKQSALKFRLDFNEGLSEERFIQFLKKIEAIQPKCDFIEDPFPFDPKKWAAIQQLGWKLACDRQAARAFSIQEAASYLIVKPAFYALEELEKWRSHPLLVTSYLGHPLDQAAAAFVSLLVDPLALSIHGLLSHLVYHETPFSQELRENPPHFVPAEGCGFGFDALLDSLKWERLC